MASLVAEGLEHEQSRLHTMIATAEAERDQLRAQLARAELAATQWQTAWGDTYAKAQAMTGTIATLPGRTGAVSRAP